MASDPKTLIVEVYGPDGTELSRMPVSTAVSIAPDGEIDTRAFPRMVNVRVNLSPHRGSLIAEVVSGPSDTIRLNGRPVAGGALPLSTNTQIGDLIIRITADKSDKRGISPTIVAATVLLPVSFWLLLDSSGSAVPEAPTDHPELFATITACPPGEGVTSHRARQADSAARAKRDRYVFAPGDGVEAVDLFAEASACFSASGEAEPTAESRRLGAVMRARVEEDYRAQRFRLERALSEGRYYDAQVEAAWLLELMGDRSDPYVDWLTLLERRLRHMSSGGST